MTATGLTNETWKIKLFMRQDVSVEDKKCIDLLWVYDFTFIRDRLLEEGMLPEQIIDQSILEYRKFMTLLRLGYPQLAMFSREVDEVWHTHILFTQNYTKFCDRVFGKFVHHTPVSRSTAIESVNNSVETFLITYTDVFGEPSPLWKLQKPTGVALCIPTREICYPTQSLKGSVSNPVML